MFIRLPETHEEKKVVHLKLIDYATEATRHGTTKGLSRFVLSWGNSDFAKLLIEWLEKFTPIRQEVNPKGHLLFRVPEIIRKDYDLGGARLNPFYTMEHGLRTPKPILISPPTSSHPHQLSDREAAVKILKIALNTFLADRSIESRQRLISLINAFPSEHGSAKGSPFMQGGAPGLKRR